MEVQTGFPEDSATHALTYLTDVHATMLAAAGVDSPRDARFCRDLAPAARGEEDAPRAELTLSMGMTQRALVEGRWKLVRYPRIDHAQLFDLASDPHELVNLSGRPEMASRVEDMSARMAALMSQAGDDAPLGVDEPQPFACDLSGVTRKPDRWQPEWIREKYFRND